MKEKGHEPNDPLMSENRKLNAIKNQAAEVIACINNQKMVWYKLGRLSGLLHKLKTSNE